MSTKTWTRLSELASQPITQFVLLGLITLLAAVLRFYRLGDWSFWYDEIFTLRSLSQMSGLSVLGQRLSFVLTYYAIQVLGISEWNARLVPALIGILSIPILYFPVKSQFGPFVALLSSALLAVSPWHIYWSQNARFYTALLLFYSLALFFLFLGFERDRPAYLLLGLLFFGLSVQERLFAFFLFPIIAGYLLIVWLLPFEKPAGLRWRNLLILLVPSLLGGIYFASKYIRDPSLWVTGFGRINNNPFWLLSGVVFYIGIPVICLGTIGGVILLLKRSRIGLLLVLAAVIPVLLMLAISLIQYAANRYVFITLTSWMILTAVAFQELYSQSRGSARLVATGLLLILLLESLGEDIVYYRYQSGNRDDWKAAFNFVASQKQPADLVVTSNQELGDYYLQESGTKNIYGVNPEELPQLGRRVWFVEDNNVGEKYPEKLTWIREHSSLEAVFDVHVRARNFLMRVYLFDPARPDALPEQGTQ